MLLPFLAHRSGRPVRWTPARSADMTGLGHSRDQYQRFTIGGDRDGTIKAMEMHVVVNNGAFSSIAPAHARNAGMVMPGPFRVPRSRWTYQVVATNTTPQAAYRGAGRPEGGAAVDRAVDRFAAEIGLDPLVVRRRNMLQADELPWTNPTNLIYESGDYPRALDKLVAELGYKGLRAEQAARRSSGAVRQLGIGLSTFIDRTAAYPGTEFGAVQLKPDGSFRVLTGSSPHGQGHYTSWAMLVAERTGVPIERIEVVHGDTDVVPRGGMTGGSKAAQKAGNAVALAAEEMVEVGRTTAAELLEAAVGDVVLDDGVFHVAGAPGAASVGWVEVGERLAAERGDSGGGGGSGSGGGRGRDGDNGHYRHQCVADFDVAAASVPYGAYGAVVDVDVETGAIELLRIVTVDDAGAILNPMLALGQVHGGLGQAIGQALYEEFVYDADGNPLTASFLDYGIPAATEMPSFESHLVEIPTETNPLGVKGIGESAAIGGVPAVQNAVDRRRVPPRHHAPRSARHPHAGVGGDHRRRPDGFPGGLLIGASEAPLDHCGPNLLRCGGPAGQDLGPVFERHRRVETGCPLVEAQHLLRHFHGEGVVAGNRVRHLDRSHNHVTVVDDVAAQPQLPRLLHSDSPTGQQQLGRGVVADQPGQ